jgi:hypothetical protein
VKGSRARTGGKERVLPAGAAPRLVFVQNLVLLVVVIHFFVLLRTSGRFSSSSGTRVQ